MKYLEIPELLKSIDKSCICESLGQDENVLSVAVDPTCNSDPESKSVIRHSICSKSYSCG